MIKDNLSDIFNFNIIDERFFTEGFDLGNLKIYPYYDLSIIILDFEESGVFSIKPLAIIISNFNSNNDIEYYLYYIDESKKSENSDKIIIEKFCEDILNLNN